jgi:hypothetical protein
VIFIGADHALPGAERTVITRVDRIGKRTLDGNVLSIENRTYRSSIILTDEQAERWRIYMVTGKVPPRKESAHVRRQPV